MRITDLLDVRSISLDAAPADKSQTLDAAVALMTRSGKINDEQLTGSRFMQERKRVLQESVRELPFLMANVMQ